MGKGLKPDWQLHSVLDIDLFQLRQLGKSVLLFDLDNTLTGWNSNELRPEMVEWFQALKKENFQALVLSNNHRERIAAVAKVLEIPFVERAGKPRCRGYQQALLRMKVPRQQAVMVGDQIFTDVFGANRVGLFTILVDPLYKKEFWGTKISRFLEYFLIHRRPVKIRGSEKPSRKQA